MISPQLLPLELTNFLTRVFLDTRAEARRAINADSAEERELHLRKIFNMMHALHNFPGRFYKNPEMALTTLHLDFLNYEKAYSTLPLTDSNGTGGCYSGALQKLLDKHDISIARD